MTVDGRRVGVTSSQGIVDLRHPGRADSRIHRGPQLVRADEDVFIVDLARRTVNQLFEDGDLGTTTCLAGSLSDATVGGTHLTGESETPRVLAHDASAAVLSVSEPNRSDCFNIDLTDVPGEIYGAPVAVDGTAYLPNWETGRIVIVDLDERVVVTTVPFASQRGVPFELEVFNNMVWANEPQGPFAALVSRQGIEPIRKLGRVVIDNNIDGGEGGASVVVSDTEDGGGRAFGDSGDPVVGDDDTDSTDTGAGGGTGLEGTDPGGTPSDETGLTPDGDEPPVGVIVNETQGTITDGLLANFEFSADTVSVGEAVAFSDTTIGDPISWNWDFGDGTGDEGPDVVKIWDEEGIFTVQLFVADAVGNQGQQSKEITVVASDVLRAPVANFTFRSETIEVGESLEFASTSTGEPDLLEWDFGDGVTAVGDVVEHQYASDGTFEVTLTATNDAGSDATSASITVVRGVTQPEAIISSFPTVLEVGQSVLIRSESTNSPTSIEWDFGDGERAVGEEVRHSWDRPGTYRIRLTVANSAGSSSTFRDVIIKPRVNPPIARFGESTLEAIVDQPISFNDLSQNQPTQITWEFGDGSSASGSNVTHSWGREGTYTVTLTVQNEAGSDEVAKTVTILPLPPDPPTASFTLSSATVPANAVVNFTDTSTGDPTEWLWDFGDGSRSRAQSPPHAFATPGSYVVTLTASNPGGSDSSTQTILVSDPPVAQFTFSTNELRATFTDTSTNSPDQWVWSFGDGTTSTAQSPTKEYGAPGTYTVSLIASNTGGSSSPTVRTVFVAKRPVAAFEASATGLTASFVDQTTNDPTQWFWDLGDGTTSSVQFPTHTYEEAGTYEVTLTATNAAGESSTADIITVQFAPPVAAFTCESVGASLVCDGTASTGAVEWSWTSSGGPVSESGVDTDRATFTYAKSGSKEVRLRVTNPAGDRDNLRQDFDVVVPEPPEITDIEILTNQGGLVQLLATADNLPTSWSWRADDAINISGESTASPTFTFDEGGNTAVFVTAANDVGTSERVRFVVNVNLLLASRGDGRERVVQQRRNRAVQRHSNQQPRSLVLESARWWKPHVWSRDRTTDVHLHRQRLVPNQCSGRERRWTVRRLPVHRHGRRRAIASDDHKRERDLELEWRRRTRGYCVQQSDNLAVDHTERSGERRCEHVESHVRLHCKWHISRNGRRIEWRRPI